MTFKALPDGELIKYCREGSDKAFNELFRRYFNKLYRFCLNYVKDEAVAESFVLDLLLKIWQSSDRINCDTTIAPYLFVALKNTIYNHLRKKYQEVLPLEELPDLELHTQTPEELLQVRELETACHRLTEQLSPQRKKVFRMSRYEQMTHLEIACKLQLSVNTVNNHINASIAYLRPKLKGCTDVTLMLLLYVSSLYAM